jgi:hypothetical protein
MYVCMYVCTCTLCVCVCVCVCVSVSFAMACEAPHTLFLPMIYIQVRSLPRTVLCKTHTHTHTHTHTQTLFTDDSTRPGARFTHKQGMQGRDDWVQCLQECIGNLGPEIRGNNLDPKQTWAHNLGPKRCRELEGQRVASSEKQPKVGDKLLTPVSSLCWKTT